MGLNLTKDLTYQDSCYWKVYLTPSEGHGLGWSKPSFWWIWCDSRGHLVLRSTSITRIYAILNPPCANLCFSFTFVRINTANGLKSMAELNLGWFIQLLCLFLFASNIWICQLNLPILKDSKVRMNDVKSASGFLFRLGTRVDVPYILGRQFDANLCFCLRFCH